MRRLFAISFAVALLTAAPAQAEKRTFLVANNADGYGVDRCLAVGGTCGNTIATAYCRAREFDHALSFRKIERGEMNGMMAASATACRSGCDDFIAIECTR
jgi:hypothetical protein